MTRTLAAIVVLAALPAGGAQSLHVQVLDRQGAPPLVVADVRGLHAGASYAVRAVAGGSGGCERAIIARARANEGGRLLVRLTGVDWCRGRRYRLSAAGLTATFVVPPDVAVRGVAVRVPGGSPARGAHLIVRNAGGRTVASIVTGAGGRFAFEAWPGRYRLEPLPLAGGLRAPVLRLTVRAGHPLRLRVAYARRLASGRARNGLA